jgi:tripartite-type tricarboxylate transporter receptor subunit TctC
VLAVSTAERSPLLPDIPTLKEAGIDVEADAWSGLIAPAGISEAMGARIAALAGEAIGSPAIRDKLAAQYMTPIPGSAAAFRARIDSDIARWAPVIAAAKIRIQ